MGKHSSLMRDGEILLRVARNTSQGGKKYFLGRQEVLLRAAGDEKDGKRMSVAQLYCHLDFYRPDDSEAG